jgi:hypothetical protein
MIELAWPELPLRDLTLDCIEAPDRVTRSAVAAQPSPGPLAGRIRIGGPHSRKVSAEFVAADPELSAYVDRQSAFFEFYVVHLTVSFAVRPVAPRLRSATVQLRLTSVPAWPEPVALSMTPQIVVDEVHEERAIRIGPELKLLEAGASLGDYTRTRSSVRREPVVLGLGLDGCEPAWEFTRTSSADLAGDHRLAMVVKTAAGSAASVSGVVTARTEGNLRRRFERELAEPLQLDSVL